MSWWHWWNASRTVALATSGQAVILAVAAAVAWVQAQEARTLRKAQAQPYVVVSLEPEADAPFLLDLVIANLGNTVARDIHVDFSPPLRSTLDKEPGSHVRGWRALDQGIATLVPGQRLSNLVESLHQRYNTDALEDRYTATVTYNGDGPRGESYTYTYDLDFGLWFGAEHSLHKGMDDLVKAVEKLADTAKSYATGSSRLKVATYDGKAADREDAERREARAQQVREQRDRTAQRLAESGPDPIE